MNVTELYDKIKLKTTINLNTAELLIEKYINITFYTILKYI